MKALITGATGFVGSAVVRKLLEHGQIQVRALVRPNSDRQNLAALDVELSEGDLCDRESLVRALQGCQLLFHVAADYRLWVPDSASMYRTNVEATRTLMQVALDQDVERIVYTSSVAALGYHRDGTPADEETPSVLEDMIGHYKRSKFLAEQEVMTLVREQGLPAVIVNPSTPIGPGDIKPTPTGKMIRDAAAGRIPAFVETGMNFVHVDDVASGHLLAWQKGEIGQRYILGGEDLSLKQALGLIAQEAGRSPPRIRIPLALAMGIAVGSEALARLFPAMEPLATVEEVKMARKHMYFSSAKAERCLGYAHRPAQDAIVDAVRWFKQQAASRGRNH
ncbi:MAG: NAD-dependent epimerase/dehydratase family protein [Pseudomonadales bacterium]|nr:NAD-dependent epimerase/dehydratase family protein [Pseudomonadales bacterium]